MNEFGELVGRQPQQPLRVACFCNHMLLEHVSDKGLHRFTVRLHPAWIGIASEQRLDLLELVVDPTASASATHPGQASLK
jgi:hypothetical protein